MDRRTIKQDCRSRGRDCDADFASVPQEDQRNCWSKALEREKFLRPGANAAQELRDSVDGIESCLPWRQIKTAQVYRKIVSYKEMSLALIEGDWPEDPIQREGQDLKLKKLANLARYLAF